MRRLARRLFTLASSIWALPAAARHPDVPRDFRLGRTATDKPQLLLGGEYRWEDFPSCAQVVAEHFGMTVVEKIDAPDVRMWITRLGPAEFCISWDDWLYEVSVIAWGDTPPNAVEELLAPRCRSCGYDLRASPDRCPECGKAVASNSSSPSTSTACNS